MSKQEVILCEGLANSLTHAIAKCPHDKLFILTDEHTHRLCRPHLDGIPALEEAEEIIIGAEDVHKNMETLAAVWQALSEKGASRHSLLINLGGGMVTDLGGFAASTFKRGIAYINDKRSDFPLPVCTGWRKASSIRLQRRIYLDCTGT